MVDYIPGKFIAVISRVTIMRWISFSNKYIIYKFQTFAAHEENEHQDVHANNIYLMFTDALELFQPVYGSRF